MDEKIFFPEKAYPSLFEDVMMQQVFEDSKTFADAVPVASPEEIEFHYQKVDRANKQQIIQFVHHWFDLPNSLNPPLLKALPIKEHVIRLWDTLIRPPDKTNKASSLIPLPYSYVVPGGRFREIYYWDSYFTMLGLKESGKIDIIKEMIKNFAWQIDHFGHIPNGNRSYFLSRSQPPFFSLMVELLSEIDSDEILVEFQNHMLIEHAFWMDGIENTIADFRRIVKLGENQSLNRYYDDSNSPRVESYAEDEILYNKTACKSDLYQNLRAACESGWDFSSRWFGNDQGLESIRTTQIIPVDLNSLLYLLEKTIARSYNLLHDEGNAAKYETFAANRLTQINQWLWDRENDIYTDFNFDEHKHGIPSLAMMYPLFAGIASHDQAKSIIKFVQEHFLKPGGWVTSNQYSGQQWDAPNGWAPLQWITYVGLKNYGAIDLAGEAAKRWLQLNEQVYNRTGRMMEKYNVEDLSLEAGGGEYPVQDGFGWTNGVYLALLKKL